MMNPTRRGRQRRALGYVMATSVLISGCTARTSGGSSAGSPTEQSVLDKVKAERVLRVGFSGYPPFLNIDPNSKQPTDGFSVELIQGILHEWDPGLKIEWVPTNWTNV